MKPVNFLELLGGGKIPEVLLGTWIVMGILLIFGYLAGNAIKRATDPVVPDEGASLRAIGEAFTEFLDSSVHGVIEDHHYRTLVPFFGSLFMFIVMANFFGLIPGFEPPTSDSDLTFALGAICFAFYIVQGFRSNGVWYLKSFLGPVLFLAPLMLPIELADNLFRPFSLGVRLYANMFASDMLTLVWFSLIPIAIPSIFLGLHAAVSVIQAFVFMLLTMIYLSMAVAQEH